VNTTQNMGALDFSSQFLIGLGKKAYPGQ